MSTVDTPETPDIPEKGWENPFAEGTYLYDLYDEVASEERDLIIIIDDYYGRRGTGKTIASLQLGNGMDQTTQGMTWSKASLEPAEIRNAYASEPLRSGLVLDEGEVGASNRQAMTLTNQALREIMSMGRVEQKYVVVNTPIRGFIDSDLQKLADVWITMMRRGLGLVHALEWEPYSKQLLTPKKQWLYFDDVPKNTDVREVYNRLTREKRKRIMGSDGRGFVPQEEHKKELKKAREQARHEERNEIIRAIHDHPEHDESTDINQRTIGESVGISRSQVNRIVHGGS